MWSVWIHAEKQQQVHRQGSNITDHRNQRATKCANPSIHYRTSPFPISPCSLVICSSANLFWFQSLPLLHGRWKTPGICSCFTLINWAEKPMSGLNWNSSFWGDDGGRHQLASGWKRNNTEVSWPRQTGFIPLSIFSNSFLCSLFLRGWKFPFGDMATSATCFETFIKVENEPRNSLTGLISSVWQSLSVFNRSKLRPAAEWGSGWVFHIWAHVFQMQNQSLVSLQEFLHPCLARHQLQW